MEDLPHFQASTLKRDVVTRWFFMVVTKILEANTATINLTVIMMVELKSKLNEQKQLLTEIRSEESSNPFHSEIYTMYQLTLENIDKRYQINDEMLLGTLLDPTFQHCEYVNTLLTNKNCTKRIF